MQGGLRVSVVDDDDHVRTATAKLLRVHGFVADGFASAEEFLRSPLHEDSDCLIVDVQMPGMSGLMLQEHLAAQGSRLPIIFVTAFASVKTEARAREAGAVCVLGKPFDGRVLIDCIRRALSLGPGEPHGDRER